MDIKEFYPSIKENTLEHALSFAQRTIDIDNEEIRIIKHARESLLYKDNVAWVKKDGSNTFDVAVGSFDGAEVCELVGLDILSILITDFGAANIGLYRDDGLGILRNLNKRQTDQARKKITKIFKDIGFDIEIETNLKRVNFLDITFDLHSETYKPYKKPNDKLMYINTSSNHPPQVIKQLPDSLSKRLSNNSSNERTFNESTGEYESALKESGYKTKLKYIPQQAPKKNRQRKIVWFNPPFNQSVETNVAKKFLKLVDKHFPRTNSLHKVFNRNNLKVSYGTTENMKQIINKHNKKVLTKKENKKTDECNCRKKEECELNGNCMRTEVIYKATAATTINPEKTYIGITEGPWKYRHSVHKCSFRNKEYKARTALADYVWKMKENHGEMPVVKWTVIKNMPAYNNISRRCLLCLQEKLCIIEHEKQDHLLNKKSELVTKCRHANKFLLKNYKAPSIPPDIT